jgi:hypothetical protein
MANITRGPVWTAEEDAQLRAARAEGVSYTDIARRVLPHRTSWALQARVRYLRSSLPHRALRPTPAGASHSPEALASLKLLRALLRFGLRHDRNLGLPIETFRRLCREHEVSLQPHHNLEGR